MLSNLSRARSLAPPSQDDDNSTTAAINSNIPYVCTRPYRAPELFYGAQGYGCEPDVWSLGCVLCEVLLCGEQLFDAEATAPAHQVMADPEAAGAKSAAQLRLLHASLGVPTEEQMVAMNPALATDRRLVRTVCLQPPPLDPAVDWRARIAATLAECGGAHFAQDARARVERSRPASPLVHLLTAPGSSGLLAPRGPCCVVRTCARVRNTQVLALFRAIFLYEPKARTTAAALARHPLWSAELQSSAAGQSGWMRG